ncbi:MAG: CapA family protein [Anaerolineales bacterium]|nr:CapA family protein [Anaerolineales bacterium]
MSRSRPSLAISIALVLLTVAAIISACRPVTGTESLGLLVQVTSVADAPTPPSLSSLFPGNSGLLAPVATQPPPTPPVVTLPAATPTPEILNGPVSVAIGASVPETWSAPVLRKLKSVSEVQTSSGPQPLSVLDQPDSAGAQVKMMPGNQATHAVATHVLAAVAPFATVADDIAFAELQERWRNATDGDLFVTPEAAPWFEAILGPNGNASSIVARDELLARLEAAPGSLGVVSFGQIDPRFKVMTVDGANVLSNRFVAQAYPLAASLTVEGAGGSVIAPLLQEVIQPATNRDASKLTQLLMTGVTAMSRVTAVKMDRNGYDYPARVISDVFAAADITHVSNEVPFLDDCVANPAENNLILCSDTDYWAALAALGTDIVGLSGNHVNDFGRDGARRSIGWYRDQGIPIYGSGLTVNEACAPLLWEDHGNTFAFIAALAFDPPGAWASTTEPGACYYYDNKQLILDMVRDLSNKADIVAVELQHQETYEPYPIPLQIEEFRELRNAGADIVTGVMSHVPQAQEPYSENDPGGAGMITYGLGNLFFDQMWSWETRTELAARHTLYDGKLISAELLTMVLEDFAQPRWAKPDERADILKRIFAAAPDRPRNKVGLSVDKSCVVYLRRVQNQCVFSLSVAPA